MPEPHSAPRYEFLRDALSRARKAADINQIEMAKRLGVSQQVVSLIESGHRRIDVVEFHAWAIAVGREPVEFYGEVMSQQSGQA